MTRDEGVGARMIAVSAIAYAVAFLVTTLLHELAHFAVSYGWGRAPTLFHNAVHSPIDVGYLARLTTTLAGPFFSAVQGACFVALERRLRQRDPLWRLLVVWLGFHGIMNATGYLFTTAFVADADMGAAARLLGIPLPGLIAATMLGFWLIRVGARLSYPGFVALLPEGDRASVSVRNRGLVRIALFAWPLGVVLVLPASLPVPHWLSLMYVLIAGIGAVWFTDFSKAEPAGAPPIDGRPLVVRGEWRLWLPWMALSLLCLGWLRFGVSL